MGLTEDRFRNFLLISTIISFIDLVIVLVVRMSNISLLLTAFLFIANLSAFLMVKMRRHLSKALMMRIKKVTSVQVAFSLLTSFFGSGLGFLSWIFLFQPGSTVRNVLMQLSPVLGWGVVVTAFLLAVLSANLNEHEKKRDGLLIGTVLFSVVGHLFMFWMSAQIFPYTIDDAFITFRYSKNLAAGFGPTYNPGLPPVEGYTTFLWMLLMTFPHVVGIGVATFSKIIGIILTCGTFTIISLLALVLGSQLSIKLRLFFGSFAVYLLAMLPVTSTHVVSGMETSLFMFLISLMVYLVTLGLTTKSRLLFLTPLIGLGIGLTRPEGNAISLLLLVYSLFYSSQFVRKRLLLFSMVLYALPGALYFLWRYSYYDLLLPLPFYLKVIHGGVLFGGLKDVGTYLEYLLPSISILLIIAIFHLKKEHIAILIPIVFLLVFYLFPIHVMGFNWRFIYPVTPFISVLVAFGGIIVLNLLRGQVQVPKFLTAILLMGFFATVFFNFQGLPDFIKGTRAYGTDIISKYKKFGDILNEYNNEHQMTIVLLDAGTVPYYSDWQVVDLFGLNDKDIAFGNFPLDEIIFRKNSVDLIFLNVGNNPKRISKEYATSQWLYEEALQQGMEKIGVLSLQKAYNVWVVGYPGTDLANHIQSKIQITEEP